MDLSFLKQGFLFGADRMLDGFLREQDLCFTIKNEIAPHVRLEDFEEMYKEGGRPPISPKVLLLVVIMQFVERLSDRAAAYNLRYRLDWKIALGLELDFEGVHPTTLVKFRDRLLANEKASYGFDKVIEYLVLNGLLKKGSKQRIDSTHIVGKVRELSRIDLLHETLWLFCQSIEDFSDEMSTVMRKLFDYYSEEISIRGISDGQKKKYASEAGLAMKAFITWAESDEPEIVRLGSFKTMKEVFTQNFDDGDSDPDGPKLIKIATGKDHISSPHDPEARFGNKGSKRWLGYKAQVAETCSDDEPNFITHVELNDATDHDSKAISKYIEEQKNNQIKPSEVYGDSHYNSEENIKELTKDDINLKGPVTAASGKTLEKNSGFTLDSKSGKAICPQGKQAEKFSVLKNGKISVRFSPDDCQSCSQKGNCQPSPIGKQIEVRAPNEILTRRREEMKTDEFREDMYKRNGIEGTISGLVRGQGIRQSRYRGNIKTNLQLKMSCAAANIKRLHNVRTKKLEVRAA